MATFHYVGLTCQNIEESKSFYEKYFGFSLRNETKASQEMMQNVFGISSPAEIFVLICENTIIELFDFSQDKQPASMGSISHFALSVADRLALFKQIKADGYSVTSSAS